MKIRVVKRARTYGIAGWRPYHVEKRCLWWWNTVDYFDKEADAVNYAALLNEPKVLWTNESKCGPHCCGGCK